MKGLIILLGGSFRKGSQGNNSVGLSNTYDEQMKGFMSQINLCKHLYTNYNIDCHIGITTYSTIYDADVINLFKKQDINILFSIFNKKKTMGFRLLLQQSIKSIDKIDNYNFTLFVRIDLYLKEEFLKIFNPLHPNIQFPFICWKSGSIKISGNRYPRVADTIIYVPSIHYKNLRNLKLIKNHWKNSGHNLWYLLITENNFNCDIF